VHDKSGGNSTKMVDPPSACQTTTLQVTPCQGVHWVASRTLEDVLKGIQRKLDSKKGQGKYAGKPRKHISFV